MCAKPAPEATVCGRIEWQRAEAGQERASKSQRGAQEGKSGHSNTLGMVRRREIRTQHIAHIAHIAHKAHTAHIVYIYIYI